MNALAVADGEWANPSGTPEPLWDFVRSSGLRALVIGTSKVPNAKLIVMLVSPVTGRCELAVKVPTTDLAAVAIHDEASMLEPLQALTLGMTHTIPRVVGRVEHHGRTGVVMTAVRGTPMVTSYTRDRHTADRGRVRADFDAVERWLAAFQDATAAGWGRVDVGAGIAERLAGRFGEDDVAADLSRLDQIRHRLLQSAVPRTAVHGDLWLGNVLLSDGAVTGVVDWEGGEPCGEPVRDLVRFVITYALFLDRHTKPGRRVRGHPELRAGVWGAGVQYSLDGRGWFPDLVRGFLRNGLERLGADPALWRDAALAGIAEFAALTDDPVFGRSVLDLFRRMA